MARETLTETKIKALKPRNKPYKASDGTIGGLHVAVSVAGGKVFCLAYRFDDKWRLLRLGAWPTFGLDEARDWARDAKKQIALGIDPAAAKQAARTKAVAEATTFRMLTARWLTWRQPILSVVTIDDTIKKLERYILPCLGDKPVTEVTKADIKAVLDILQAQGKYETLKKVRTIISQALRFAIDEEAAPGIVDWTTQLHRIYTCPLALRKHRAAVTTPKEIAGLMRAIDAYRESNVLTHLALKFSALTFCRPGEVRRAEWSEVDWDNKLLRIPAEKMKMRQPHLVPLAEQTLEILRELKVMTGHTRYLFPSVRTIDRPMSEATVNAAIRRMGYEKSQMCAHGFRGMASSILNENGFNRDFIERQLAHAPLDKVRAAYLHTEFLKGRTDMMRWWADYLDGVKDSAAVQG
ncbi:Site-specific recombinase, phage integrase family [uncultured delta proteobacterium]|uniref:Site-specific recombinase, phage integrase family n=1 Tax=uncultured delta proteobacterium TaxID=34034 RepID=A0A212JFC8_9DELT|nr:Site-specific recombinase, phage integrase family [uncultured delta proteobacterium]